MRKLALGYALVSALTVSASAQIAGDVPDLQEQDDGGLGTGTLWETFAISSPAGNSCSNLQSTYVLNDGPFDREAVPGSGLLGINARVNPASINDSGRMAFVATVTGAPYNQAIFVSDDTGTYPIVRGCGGAGGSGNRSTCGQAAPVGGTFAGFFRGSLFAPNINAGGDVLFLSDIANSSVSRGLFLYRASNQTIVTVAALNGAYPGGGTISAIGPGSLNNSGQVVFFARHAPSGAVNILRWENGQLARLVSVGDEAPARGDFDTLCNESKNYPDGTNIPTGPAPAINNHGDVSFFGVVGGYDQGLFVKSGGTIEWYVRAGEFTPVGGSYIDLWAPLINDNGQIAFFADFGISAEHATAGWFMGSPGGFRKVLEFHDTVAGGDVVGLSVSRNTVRAFDNCGNLLLRCTLQRDDERLETVVIVPQNGLPRIVAQQGAPGPDGGTVNGLCGWPAMNNRLRGVAAIGVGNAPNFSAGGYYRFQGEGAVDIFITGDMNCDQIVNNFDVDPFVLALTSAPAYNAAFPDCNRMNADANHDGLLNNFDIDAVINCIVNGCE